MSRIGVYPPVDGADGVPSLRTLGPTVASNGWALTTHRNPTPALNKYVGWTLDPKDAVSAGTALSAGRLYYGLIKVPVSLTGVTGVDLEVTTGSGASSNCYLGLYTISGTTATLAIGSADQSASWNTSGAKSVTLSSTPLTGGNNVVCAVAILFGAVTTAPKILCQTANSLRPNKGLTAGVDVLRWGLLSTTGLTAMPASFDLTSCAANEPNFYALVGA